MLKDLALKEILVVEIVEVRDEKTLGQGESVESLTEVLVMKRN